jgi:hypothetical protein
VASPFYIKSSEANNFQNGKIKNQQEKGEKKETILQHFRHAQKNRERKHFVETGECVDNNFSKAKR